MYDSMSVMPPLGTDDGFESRPLSANLISVFLIARRMSFSTLVYTPRLSDRVADALRKRILGGALAISDQLPSENAMAAEFGVSRAVVREAVSRLKSEGLLYARQGKGIFVAPTALIR